MALERLRVKGIDIYSAPLLHAKVYAFDDVAFVGSANASSHSAQTLLEAVQRIRAKSDIKLIRSYISSLSLTKLSHTDLLALKALYKKPKQFIPNSQQAQFSTLLMELKLEQGGGRESKVQPPKSVWENYFGFKLGSGILPTLTLVSEGPTPHVQTQRQVVKHHHIYTIEIPHAGLPRPAILSMRRLGPNRYAYRVYRPGDLVFANLQQVVKTALNPLWQSGRRWVLI